MRSIYSLHDDYMKAFLAICVCALRVMHVVLKIFTKESDITLADFWGVQHPVPTMDDDKGTSLVVLHNRKAMNGSIKHNMRQKCIQSIWRKLLGNSAMTSSVKPHPDRATFFLDVDSSVSIS